MVQKNDLAQLRDAWGQFSTAMFSVGQDDAKQGKPRGSENSDYQRGYNAGLPKTCICGEPIDRCANCSL